MSAQADELARLRARVAEFEQLAETTANQLEGVGYPRTAEAIRRRIREGKTHDTG